VFPTGPRPHYNSGPLPAFTDNATGDRAYRVVSPVPVTHHGQARGVYGNYSGGALVLIDPNYTFIRDGWGNPQHFVLTRPFDPSERMRQVVFWSVDWQSYEDFEELPAPEHDSSMCFRDSNGVHVSADWWGVRLPERGNYWLADKPTSSGSSGGPWADSPRTLTTSNTRSNYDPGHGRTANGGNQTYDAWTDSPEYKAGYFMGYHGADRNGNKRYDRGAVPASVRLRAKLIGRFFIYDRILVGEGRH
jgi:hypothetical protein